MRKDNEIPLMQQAVLHWYRYYEVSPDEPSSRVLRLAATKLYGEGYRSVEDIATMLIGTYVGIWSTKVNAPGSSAVH